MDVSAITTASSNIIQSRQHMSQNFLLVWVDANIDQTTADCQNALTEFRSIVNDVHIFTGRDESIDFLTEIDDMKAFLVVEGTMGQHIVPLIHNIPQLDAIYFFDGNELPSERWMNEYTKINGVHTEVTSICKALKLATKQCNEDSIAMSFVSMCEGTSSRNLDQLEPYFMYTQIFKEILLKMKYNEQSMKDFIQLWRQHYINNIIKLRDIDEFERDYSPESAITWYTREYFLYEMLNRTLRTLESDTIINMGFFIQHLHEQIEGLYQKQVSSYHGKSFLVYRGQGLLKIQFEKLVKTKGGLMSFNNFLSTSPDRDVSFFFAESALVKTDTVGILFKMIIDPSISSAPFASIRELSYHKIEEEVLFSMHTVFRVDEITKIDDNNLLYQVDLTLTADDDQQLRTLTECIRNEVEGRTGWEELSMLLVKIGHFHKAEELYNVLLKQTSDEGEKALYYNNLGYIKDHQGDYEKAIENYKKALEIQQKILPPNPHLASSYNNFGLVYYQMGEYSKSIPFYEKALEIWQKNPPNHPDFAASYKNIGWVYRNTGDYSKALAFYEKAIEIEQKILPPNHPDLTASYNNISGIYVNVGDYPKALSFYEKTREIFEKTLPSNHPYLAVSYNNNGLVYMKMGEYPKALLFYEKTREIFEKTLSSNHPELATCYNNIGLVYYYMWEYSKALSFFQKSLEIQQESLPHVILH